jgi:hypothetical protein
MAEKVGFVRLRGLGRFGGTRSLKSLTCFLKHPVHALQPTAIFQNRPPP